MKNNIAKVLGVVLTAATLVSMFVFAAPTAAATIPQAYNSYAIPSTTGMVLNATITAGGPIAQAMDSSALYVYVMDNGVNKILKSVDNGRTWKNVVVSGAPAVPVVEIVCSPVEANVVFYITATTLYMSTDAGLNFTAILNAPGTDVFTSFDVSKWGTPSRYIAVVGTNDSVASDAGVYYWDQSLPFNNLTPVGTTTFTGWTGNFSPVLSVKMAPTFATDRAVVAVGYDATTFTKVIRMDVNGGAWGAVVPDVTITGAAPTAGDIAFPSDFNYQLQPIYFVAIADTTNGGVFRVIGATATPILAQATAFNMSYVGSFASSTGSLLVGLTNGNAYLSSNSGNSFGSALSLRSYATPAQPAWVLLDHSFATSKMAWILNVGNPGGALNVATDGATFNQWSLINETIANGTAGTDGISGIIDFAAGSNGDLYMITTNSAGTDTSIWRNLVSAGTPWERVFNALAAPASTANHLTLAADYATGKDLAYWYTNQTAAIQVSVNNANSFKAMTTAPQVISPATAISVSSLYMPNATTAIVGDNTGTIVTNQTSAGTSAYWWTGTNLAPFGTGYTVSSIVGAGGTNLLAAAYNGTTVEVATSKDNGLSWTLLTKTITSAGAAFIAPADDYATTGALYVAAAGIWMYPSATGGFARVDSTAVTAVPSIGITADAVTTATGIVTAPATNTSTEGTGMIYATDSGVAANIARIRGHSTTAEKLNTTLTDTFSGIWLGSAVSGNVNVWTKDTSKTGLYFYNDTLGVQGTGVTVSNLLTSQSGLFGIVPAASSATISWTALANATNYAVFVNQTQQTNLYAATEGTGVGLTSFVPGSPVAVTYATGTTTALVAGMIPGVPYFVSIWAIAPVSSFMFGTTIQAPLPPVGPVVNLVPAVGAQGVSVNPSFGWTGVTGATSYTLQCTLATDSAYATPVINVSNVPASANDQNVTYNWTGTALANNTAYIWRVKANITGGGSSGWVNGNFTTEKVVVPPVTVTNNPPQTIIFPTITPSITLTLPAPVTVAPTYTLPVNVTVTQQPEVTPPTPAYIWVIVGVGAILTIAVIVLIIRTRRVV
jgi:trimeric autotransporter adhesin